MAEELSVEGSGETVGEAKWAALRELERVRPGIDKAAVQFEVLTEGKRGLLGVGYAPALVVARLADLPEPGPSAAPPDEPESELLADVRQIVERIAASLGATCRVEARQKADHIDVQCSGGDLGVLIGRHGQTIDAIQYLVNAIASRREGERVEVVVDAAGYRSRRQSTLETIAVRAARRALDDREPVELEPMTAIERKLVHTRLEDFRGVETSSEGTEPNRFVVISPVD